MMYPSTRGPSSRVAVDLGETDGTHDDGWTTSGSSRLPPPAPPETERAPRPRSYWRRRYEQWARGDEPQENRARKAYAPGTIATLPMPMQIAFRRKMLSIFALQLLVLTALVASLTYDSMLSEWTHDTFKRTVDLVGPLVGSIAALSSVYFVRTRFPLNWLMVAAFSLVLSLLVAGVQTWLDTPAGLFCCGFTFVTVCVMIVLSGLSYRYHGDEIPSGPSAGLQPDTNGEVVLRSSLVSGCMAFAISAVISGVLYAIVGDTDGFVSLRALGYSLALELVLIVWFSYDASSMYSIMTPDEYMSGVVYFYVDLIVLTCAAFFLAGIMFVAAMFCPTASFGYCNCNGCLCFSRARQEDENDDAGVIPYDVDEDGTISYGVVDTARDREIERG
ncbi:hypothetical protein PHYPSEUDO_000668 [Phytophthora pseudosyringae]|uniref:Uncharacterized protein n=1 Tax=Phytophthora pseudosyringae TaxID=221518 RepID=A0A8T1VYR3_9STRA|nr:hypothetical protein PHYPSEUDO_000668 [Phytophthora pseudosyringae]